MAEILENLLVGAPPQPKRWTYDELLRLDDLGLFGERRIELIDGEILEMSPTGSRHAEAVTNV